jgi:hypothetical protein
MEERVRRLEAIAEDTTRRLTSIEQRLTSVEQDIAVLKAKSEFYATKADIADVRTEVIKGKNSVIMWVVSAIFLAQLLPYLLKQFGL